MSETNDQTIDAYNKSVDTYVTSSPQVVDGHVKTWLDTCLRRLSPDARIMEVGVAHGKDADYIEAQGFKVIRTDASQGFVDYQKSKGNQASILNVLTAEIPAGNDMVLADAVWLHFTPEEAENAAANVRSSLNDGGIFALSVKEGNGEEVTAQKLDHARYFCYWQPAEFTDMLQRAGFAHVEISQATDYRPGKPDWLMAIAHK